MILLVASIIIMLVGYGVIAWGAYLAFDKDDKSVGLRYGLAGFALVVLAFVVAGNMEPLDAPSECEERVQQAYVYEGRDIATAERLAEWECG